VEVEVRLKIGEALMKVARRCGEALPHHAGMFLPALLRGGRDPEPLVRASSLSALATMCQLLRFSVHSFIGGLLECITCVLTTDRQTEPQRAAVFLLQLLLKGLGHDIFDALGGSSTEVLKLLRVVESTNPDEVTRCHARAALAELDEVVKAFMSPGRKMPAGVFLPSRFDTHAVSF
jgi:hypothetical protein